MDGTTHLTGDNRGCGSGRHDETEHQTLRQIAVFRKIIYADIRCEAKGDLRKENDPMPSM